MATVTQRLTALSGHIGRDKGITARHLCARLDVPEPLAAWQMQAHLVTRPDAKSLTVKLYQLSQKGSVHIVGTTLRPGQGPHPFATYSLTAAPNPR